MSSHVTMLALGYVLYALIQYGRDTFWAHCFFVLAGNFHFCRVKNGCASASERSWIPEYVLLSALWLGSLNIMGGQTILWLVCWFWKSDFVDVIASSEHFWIFKILIYIYSIV
jgi:hypothetical protein